MAIETERGRAQPSMHDDDPEIWSRLQRDHDRHNQTLNFIASENYASPAVLEALASHLNAKYAEGYPQGRYYQGVALADDIETLAIERHLAARNLHPGGAPVGDLVADALARAEDRGVEAHVLVDRHRAVASVARADETQAPALVVGRE